MALFIHSSACGLRRPLSPGSPTSIMLVRLVDGIESRRQPFQSLFNLNLQPLAWLRETANYLQLRRRPSNHGPKNGLARLCSRALFLLEISRPLCWPTRLRLVLR